MSLYRKSYNTGNENHYFDTCRTSAGTPLDEIYTCCLKKCAGSTGTNGAVCRGTCSGIFPGSIMEDCAVDQGCFSDTFSQECVRQKQDAIQTCCFRKCSRGEYGPGEISSIVRNSGETIPRCKEYCQVYQLE